jgi:sugar fermentation stimulation protein A
VKYAEASRVDFLLTHPDRPPCWLEVKNVHFSRTPGLAEFPDCKADRSTRHLADLAAQVARGDRAVALFVVQREDCETFQACAELDPKFAAGLDAAAKAGVEVLVYACAMGTEAITVSRRIAWRSAPLAGRAL